MIGLIYAINDRGVLGKGGALPWRHAGDMKRFKRLTLGHTVVMGRKTWESIGSKPLPGRTNIVVTSQPAQVMNETFRRAGSLKQTILASSVEEALCAGTEQTWVIGGASLYLQAEPYADVIDATYVPDDVTHAPDVVYLPLLHLKMWWQEGTLIPHEDAPGLHRRRYVRLLDHPPQRLGASL